MLVAGIGVCSQFMFYRLRADRCRSGGAGRSKNTGSDSAVVRSRDMLRHLAAAVDLGQRLAAGVPASRPRVVDQGRQRTRRPCAALVGSATTITRSGRGAVDEGGN